MQGVLIVSADPAVRTSLRVILQHGRTVHERMTAADALALAATQRMDVIFVDDVFPDAGAADLVRELSRLGYGPQIVPLLLSLDPPCTEPFQPYGVRHFVAKPFQVARIREIVGIIEYPSPQQQNPLPTETWHDAHPAPAMIGGPVSALGGGAHDGALPVSIREVAQRLQRLLSRSLKRADLFRAFAEALEEQFDVDNVVILLPADDTPEFRVFSGNVVDEVREQFFIPFGQPLLAALARLGEPFDLRADHRLERTQADGARLYAERLGIRLLCPVLSRGRLLALVGLSRSHRYEEGAAFRDLLRVFLSFFARALEHATEHEHLSAGEARYRMIVDALPAGAVLASTDGTCLEINRAAAALLRIDRERFIGLPVEKLDSRLAGLVRETLATDRCPAPRLVPLPAGPVEVSTAAAFDRTFPGGVVLMLRRGAVEAAGGDGDASAQTPNNWQRLADALAHNFKNALVPVKTCAELLPERHDDEEFRQSFFQVTRDGLDRVDAWIEQLSRFAQIEAVGRRLTTFSLHDALEGALEKAVAEFPEMSVDVARDYSGKDKLRAARGVIEQAFVELIRNALTAMKENGEPRLRLCTQVFAAAVQATIIDNGPGVPPEHVQTVFEPFHTNGISGLGLGLSYVRNAVRIHRGKVKLVPAIGAGACFQVVLPTNLTAEKAAVGLDAAG
ncbi:MAG: response regulator [Kiritimatiellaeota bacterium]|nr:response regulator [Kiritimatiellota bacterium]